MLACLTRRHQSIVVWPSNVHATTPMHEPAPCNTTSLSDVTRGGKNNCRNSTPAANRTHAGTTTGTASRAAARLRSAQNPAISRKLRGTREHDVHEDVGSRTEVQFLVQDLVNPPGDTVGRQWLEIERNQAAVDHHQCIGPGQLQSRCGLRGGAGENGGSAATGRKSAMTGGQRILRRSCSAVVIPCDPFARGGAKSEQRGKRLQLAVPAVVCFDESSAGSAKAVPSRRIPQQTHDRLDPFDGASAWQA